MKHFVLSGRWLLALPLALLVPRPAAQAQTSERRSSFGLNLSALQYQGNFGSDYWKLDRSRYAPGVAINLYLGRGVDLNSQLLYGELAGSNSNGNRFNTQVISANLGFKFKLNNGWALKENAFIQPYLLAAPGWTYASRISWADGKRNEQDQGYVDLFGAAGINLRLGGGVGLFVQTGQHLPLDGDFDGIVRSSEQGRWQDRFLQHTVGLTFNLGQPSDEDQDDVPDRQDRCPNTPEGILVDEKGCPLDSDRDGVPDYQDQCPEVVGTVELKGCADKDGDGVTDGDDACPDVAGKAELQGCPDADNDGVPDQEDKCAETPAGTQVDPSGCPVEAAPSTPTAAPDADKDGVPDAEDRCPASFGTAANRGCPEVKTETRTLLREATRFIAFESSRAVLLPTSYQTLDGIAQALNEYPDYTLSIAGHTDSKGAAAYNLRLSEERAAAARRYLVEKGVAAERIELRGYGALKPVADNAAEAGRAQNRRVEFDLYLNGDPNPAEAKYGPVPPPLPAPAPAKKATPVRKAPVRKAAGRKAPAAKAATRPAAKASAIKAPTRPAAPAPKATPGPKAARPVAKPVAPQAAAPKAKAPAAPRPAAPRRAPGS